MVSGVQSRFGKLDILVNNVGIQFVSPVEDFPEDKWDAIMDICLNSTFHATKAALPGMLERGWGRIINTGSMHALVASPYKSAYNAAKHGVVSLLSYTCNKIKMRVPRKSSLLPIEQSSCQTENCDCAVAQIACNLSGVTLKKVS